MHIRCPHCHNPIEVVGDESLSDLACPSCGSKFSLISGETTGLYEPGLKTLGHFELIQQVGLGAFGTVWKARDTKLDRTVALKVPRKQQLVGEEAELFLREARAAAQLRHPNIVGVHEVGRERETFYIVSDFVEGANLKEWLTGQRLTPREAAELCSKVADALHQAHERGVVHRDLKPGNIMLDKSGEPHITDFGLAKREAGEITMTVEGRVLGTPAYMSPEQASGKAHEADRRTDIYSLGVILFELLTGELPFRGEERMLIVQVLRDEPPRPRKLASHVPRDLETICLRCLEKEPHRRYQTAKEVSEDLTRYLRGEPVHARPVTELERAIRWVVRRPAVAALWASIFLAAILGTSGGLAFSQWRRAEAALADAQHHRGIAEYLAGEEKRQRGIAEQRTAEAEKQRAEAHQSREQRERMLHLRSLASANSSWPEDPEIAAKAILACPLSSRRWEWHFLDRVLHQEIRTFEVGFRAAISPDGKWIASGEYGGTIKVWDAETGQLFSTFAGHTERVTSLAFSPHGRRIVSGSDDRTVKVWHVQKPGKDLVDEGCVITLKGHNDEVTSVAFSPDEKLIVSGSKDGEVRVWNAENGEGVLTLKAHGSDVEEVAFSPDGRSFATRGEERGATEGETSDHTAKVWKLEGGKKSPMLEVPCSILGPLAFSPDGKRIAVGDGSRLEVWDLGTSERVLVFEDVMGLRSVAFSPDGKRIAGGGDDGSVRVWASDGKGDSLTLNKNHDKDVTRLRFTPDGKRIACGYYDGCLDVWDARTGEAVFTLSLQGHYSRYDMPYGYYARGVDELAFNRDATRIISVTSDSANVWDAQRHSAWLTLDGHAAAVTSVAFSPDGKRIASGSLDHTVQVWDAKSGRPGFTLKGHTAEVMSVAFSPDGERIASGSEDRTIKVWDAPSGQVKLTLKGHMGAVRSVAFSPDGKHIAGGSYDGTIKVWDAHGGREERTLKGHLHYVVTTAFSPDGKYVASGSYDGTIKLWDVQHGTEAMTLSGHEAEVFCIAFSADGSQLASTSHDETVKVWDLQSGRERLTINSQQELLGALAFSPDGRRLVGGSHTEPLIMWDAVSGEELPFRLPAKRFVTSVAFSPDGNRIAMGCGDETVVVLDATPRKVRSLDLSNAATTEAELVELAGQKLTELKIPDFARTDVGLKHYLAAIERPEKLDLSDWKISDEALRQLAGLALKSLHIPRAAQTDLGLKHCLAAVKSPENLDLSRWRVTDDGLKRLAGQEKLHTLDLSGTLLTDAGLAHLLPLKGLRAVSLSRTKISDAGLQRIAESKLSKLDLAGTNVTDSGLKYLMTLKELRYLDLEDANVTDAGLRYVAELRQLEELSLAATKVTDTGLRELTALERLKQLDLSSTKVSVAGLKSLAKFQNLTLLWLLGVKVSENERKELKKSLPKCRIKWSPIPRGGGGGLF